ncbi:hypothetical protein DCE79_10200 [Lysinibacillus sp. 2017]|uniref:hypothetical protein n=1 Tax=unclassified Lysinibacillus TaxID=2636778 RepID=UPI000D526F28|nr:MULTISPECIES: hypothetical protein [unclassified Lysinibacillus]AWE07733.1 hypothetical protein DCE79_10200 [Lysinibacillus sp. 2017]TGN32303.1 hypothetical protein E4L99_15350 [Lysinibacillus sp. S2017]
MLKRILIIIGILLVGITSFSLLNKPLEDNTAVANKEEQKPSFTKEEKIIHSILNSVTEKIHEKYEDLKFSVGSTSAKELRVQVSENEEYFNSVKENIESIAKSEIKSSILKDYTVIVMRLDLSFMTEEHKKMDDELLLITKSLNEGLKADYDVFKNITTSSQKSITIYTSIKGSGKKAQKLAMDIEETINKILQSKELNSVPQIDSYEIKVLNAKGKVVN